MTHEESVEFVFKRACEVLKLSGFKFRPMLNRVSPIKNSRRSYDLGHTSLKTKSLTVDIYTAKKREPKKISAILAVIAHELAHHQKLPYRERYRGRVINRIHYPAFYRQVNKNIGRLKKDKILRKYY